MRPLPDNALPERDAQATAPVRIRPPRGVRAWLPLLVLPGLVLIGFPRQWPPWGLMWALAFAIFGGAKWLTWWSTPGRDAPPWRHAAYLLGWPGLDAAAFLDLEARPARPRAVEWVLATAKLLTGGALLFCVARRVPQEHVYLVGWVGMIGMILVLHFGVFHLLSCLWRRLGVDARPLMRAPLLSMSLNGFWGRRWNTAFRDLTHRYVFRPLVRPLGAGPAMVAVFALSGLVHELVISVPARAGYGGPTLFFLVQAAALSLEGSAAGRRMGLGRGGRGFVFTVLALVLPAVLLFHPPFVTRVIVPFMAFIGAL